LTSTPLKLCGGEQECDIRLLKEAIESLSRAAESRELQTAGHGDMVARYTGLMARALHLPAPEAADLIYAARVHDVGKIFVPERILNKAGPLTEQEYQQVQAHARIGAEIVGTIPHSGMMREAVEHHHQRFDGTGYPGGLRGEEIPLWARIIAVADAHANMLTEQSVSAARTPDQALEELAKMSGTSFDGMLVRVLLRGLRAEKTPSAGN
jgi:HD-GYP domain-containing protein (c-di-GMP phosphodiesterase class II)